MSVRIRLTLSYAGFLLVAGTLLLAVVWVFLLRYVPSGDIATSGPFVPNRGDLVRAFLPPAAWALLFLLLLGLVGGWVLAGRMLAPLDRITTATRQAAQGALSHRIRLEGRQDEFRELADSFDSMLARLEAQVAEQQRFAANASHELRTPLATTQVLLDVARSDPDTDTRVLLERLAEINGRAIDLTQALLLLSRAEQVPFDREEVDLSLLAETAAESLLPLAERRGVAVEVSGNAALTSGSRALLLQLTTNLLHNAIVHNLPSGGTVSVTTASSPGWATLTLENSGEPLPPSEVGRYTEPFQRGADRARSDHDGVGLGLAIAARIVHAHGGTLELVPRAEGGLRATVALPGT
ncbi:HAMP domain-containing histidine kinase [Cnuibacter physcomitrellae]|uniref:sensor histidine kinase n=1 Tax=Cnuibacter physcomitrellae TaxID=1619308 RepID=UPI0021760CB6|nr:HAMP domain-containing sensor histidine kinase [Cnuibacter physcomitrellae]MCS5497724.1 HAMP domain-containing histidine kinase [Cnuibacter physcomitrellae]